MDQNSPKLKFDGKNFITGLFLLTLLNVLGPSFVDPKDEVGQVFYFSMAVITAFMFPFIRVERGDDDASKS
jgi:hypothetical protein